MGLETGFGLETGLETNFCALGLGLGCFAPVLVSKRCGLGLVAQNWSRDRVIFVRKIKQLIL